MAPTVHATSTGHRCSRPPLQTHAAPGTVTLQHVSLTGHLGDRRSPVRAFFAAQFPNTPTVVRRTAADLRRTPSAPLAIAPGVNAGLAGTAIDYLVRFAVADTPVRPGSAAFLGARLLGPFADSADAAVARAVWRVTDIEPSRQRSVPAARWQELARLAVLLAVFEGVFRSGGFPPPRLADPATKTPKHLTDWFDLVVPDAVVDDVARVAAVAVNDHAYLRDPDVICNPLFEQSVALGGADGDLITSDGVLVELKTTSSTRVCQAADLWQLVGYALADTADTYAIQDVALTLLRWRTHARWPLHGLLEDLAGRPVDLAALRHEFAAVLTSS